jgi:hypothetical protein
MADLIVIRLVPAAPVDGATFTQYLNNLKIEAFELDYAYPTQGASIGPAAVYIAPTLPAPISSPPPVYDAPPVFDPASGIVQHFDQSTGLPPILYAPVAVATAVIKITSSSTFENIRLKVSRNGQPIPVDEEYFNIQVASGSPAPAIYPGLTPVSFYLTLPAVPLSGTGASVNLPADGTPAAFSDVLAAMHTVLGIDPGGSPSLATLTAQQCRLIAYEILWSQQNPLPPEPETLENLYNNPPNSGTTSDPHEQNRRQFESALTSFYATKDADAQRLTTYVYSVAAAFACQQESLGDPQPLTEMTLSFPVNAGLTPAQALGYTQVCLVNPGGGPLPVVVGVPAAYFYALAATMPPQVDAPKRYQLATGDKEARILSQLSDAINLGVIGDSQQINGAGAFINPAQAARRMTALSVAATVALSSCKLTASIAVIVNDWLGYGGDWPDPAASNIDAFWNGEAGLHAGNYLDLVLSAVTEGFIDPVTSGSLADLIKAGLQASSVPPPVSSVAVLMTALSSDWKTFFQSHSAIPDDRILPPFTEPGDRDARVLAFIRHVQTFFKVAAPMPPASYSAGNEDAPNALRLPSNDWLAAVLTDYASLPGGAAVTPATLGSGLDAVVLQQAAASVFADDSAAQDWAVQALLTLDALYGLVKALAVNQLSPTTNPDAVRFSIMEALYARGFTTLAEIQLLSAADFQMALSGTVAYDYAAPIYSAAGGTSGGSGDAGGSCLAGNDNGQFSPVNPGDLVDCVPAPCLSPLSAVAYLHHLLKLNETASCAEPGTAADSGHVSLGEAIGARCGPLGQLAASCANLEIPLPLIDIVNENLESLVLSAPDGFAVHDTSDKKIGTHRLCDIDCCHGIEDEFEHDCEHSQKKCHDPAQLYETLPAWSSPAAPVGLPDVYQLLKNDFSTPALPYNQPLDISRNYLHHLRSSRYETMRRFRREITEFVHTPALPAPTFQSHLWRYPVRLDLAVEYLCLSPEEFSILFEGAAAGKPWILYGLPAAATENDGASWQRTLSSVSGFLQQSGLSYCELVALQKTGFIPISYYQGNLQSDSNGGKKARTTKKAGQDLQSGATVAGDGTVTQLPDCEPCCLERMMLRFGEAASNPDQLVQLAVFVRLWRKLQCRDQHHPHHAKYSMQFLADVCSVLFPITGGFNAEFVRQFAALLMLHEVFELPLFNRAASGAGPADRTSLLALWLGSSASQWQWAIAALLKRVSPYARLHHHCQERPPQFIKLLEDNLDPLSCLAGFNPGDPATTWHAKPTCTLRFLEVLSKIYASTFSVGEILYLFTAQPHLNGDDPFFLQTVNDALEFPLDLPEAGQLQSLAALRLALLEIEVSAEEAEKWSWKKISAVLRDEFSYQESSDALLDLGRHFFPETLNAHGVAVSSDQRRYAVALPGSSAQLWNAPFDSPMQYDAGAGKLWIEIPLSDAEVIAKMAEMRQLSAAEGQAAQDVYFLPRQALANFSFLFESFAEADQRLIQEPDQHARWKYFQHQFALCHTRCKKIAHHLAEHMQSVRPAPASTLAASDSDAKREEGRQGDLLLAWEILKRLSADRNPVSGAWENDAGTPPASSWPLPAGGAFAALLGLSGTGLKAQYSRGHPDGLVWRAAEGPLNAFGAMRESARNRHNVPLPTILPPLDLTLTAQKFQYASLHNGLALNDNDGQLLGGASGFSVAWRGVLLLDQGGDYRFLAGAPTADGEAPDMESADQRQWRVCLQRGQRTWVLLNHQWPEQQEDQVPQLDLQRGAYTITIQFRQAKPLLADECECDIGLFKTGFTVKYCGPDSNSQWLALPLHRLFIDRNDATQDQDLPYPASSVAHQFLSAHYVSSLRDIRRTYQRAFKGMLLASRFGLSAKVQKDVQQSEIGYMFDHPEHFAGAAYYLDGGAYVRHLANFDFDYFPLLDSYQALDGTQDQRVQPTLQRQQALFDWWERCFDYVRMRDATAMALARPAWNLFQEAWQQQPADCTYLLRHIEVDLRHGDAVLHYHDHAANDTYALSWDELLDDRWALRAWHGNVWIERVLHHFDTEDEAHLQPCLWVSDDPSLTLPGASECGNGNLVELVDNGEFEQLPPPRYQAVRMLNDCLRQRARDALVAYLTQQERVVLPWGGFATTAGDLSDLLLIDVQAGICEKASRIEAAVSAVQNFIRRARLGLESGWAISSAFAACWDQQFCSFFVWERCALRKLYRENVIDWEEWHKARKIEAFQLLTDQLRRNALSIAVPGGLEWWPDQSPPQHDGLHPLQEREPSVLQRVIPPREGLNLQGVPERDARPGWITAVADSAATTPLSNPGKAGVAGLSNNAVVPALLQPFAAAGMKLPYWIETAVKMGTRFYRVAAAGVPLGGNALAPKSAEQGCCRCCGKIHPEQVDEYYFWLEEGEEFSEPESLTWAGSEPHNFRYGFQDDYYDQAQQQSSLWQDPSQLPKLLDWRPQKTVRLAWSRMHNGEFQPPRRSDSAIVVTDPASADLIFQGRVDDSITFAINGAPQLPVGYQDPTPPGFRYDLRYDVALTLPLVAAANASGVAYPAGLIGYPFFLYDAPGAPLFPSCLFNPVLAIAGALRTHCRFEAALKWLQLAYDPLQQDATWVHCQRNNDSDTTRTGNAAGAATDTLVAPRTKKSAAKAVAVPAASNAAAPAPAAGATSSNAPPAGDITLSLSTGYGDGPQLQAPAAAQACCNNVAINDASARRRSLLLHFLETSLDWIDALMRQNTPEAFQQARLLADTAARILGERPRTVSLHSHAGASTVANFVAAFPGLNPRLLALYDKVADRRGLIHHCLSSRRIAYGQANCDLPYFGNTPFRDGWMPAFEPCVESAEGCYLPSPYRFEFLIAKAQQLAAKLKEVGNALLLAYEKGDAEYLASMRARFEEELQTLTVTVRQDQWRDADWQIQALQKTKEFNQANLVYYSNLVRIGLIPDEIQYQNLTNTAMITRAAGNIVEAIGEVMKVIPDMFVGFPCNEAQLPVGTKLAGIFESAARIVNVVADIESTTAGLDLTNAGWERRMDEWVHQTQTLPIEIQQIERQILGAQRRRDQAMLELNHQQRQSEQAMEALNYLRDKFTSHELYLYYQKELAALFFRTYELTLHVAHQAQRSFNLQRDHGARTFIPGHSWDSLKEGLLAGERLEYALERMETAYLDENVREHELTKHFSLRSHFPVAYLQLRATGHCEIDIPEWMFDLDYPGMYMRRIKNVSLTLPCVTGPYTGVHCQLTLLSSRTRIDPRIQAPPHRCCSDRSGLCDVEACEDDPRFIRQFAARESLATSGGQNDSGLFELNFHDERYLPFEYQGAISRWRVDLPRQNNYFDPDTLSDLMLHMNYTARDGGELLRCAAQHCAERHMPGDGWSLFEVRHEFPAEWSRFRQQAKNVGADDVDLDLEIRRSLFPFIPGANAIIVDRIAVLFEIRTEDPAAEYCTHFGWKDVGCEGKERDPGGERGDPDEDIVYQDLPCSASEEWPCLYVGMACIHRRTLRGGEANGSRLRFECAPRHVDKMFIMYHYHSAEKECDCLYPLRTRCCETGCDKCC